MAYARLGVGSDVYVFRSADSLFHCMGCSLDGEYECSTRAEMIRHLYQHRMTGEKVPESAIIRMRDEQVGDHRQVVNPDYPVYTVCELHHQGGYEDGERVIVCEWADWAEQYLEQLDQYRENPESYASWMKYIPVRHTDGRINGYYPQYLKVSHKHFVEEKQEEAHDGNQDLDEWVEI